MAYDEDLADRFRRAIEGVQGTSEKKMMGGICFFVNGNMLGGVSTAKNGRRFMFRVGKENIAEAEAMSAGEEVVMGARRMPGFFHVEADACDDDLFRQWTSLALSHATALPPK